MRPGDRPLLVAAMGLLALWVGSTDVLYRFLRPTMRPWLVLSGLVLVALAAVVGSVAWRRPGERTAAAVDDGHAHRPSRVGWLLLLPVVVAIALDPMALGAASVSRSGWVNRASLPDFDLAAHLRGGAVGGQAMPLSQGRFVAAADDERQHELLASTPVRLTGFVASVTGPDRFVLSRLQLGCCAGDAIPLNVAVHAEGHAPPGVDTWVEVEGRFDVALTRRTRAESRRSEPPVLAASAIRTIDPPDEPYEYPS